ncbi:MAG: flagellar biosynthesis regulator FlaF [Rhodobacteraceae bacterium]|nr:flagellar biosynthesis regulator FlaF [Paracoccaceae bacterium]
MIAQSEAAYAAYSRPEAPQRNPRAVEYDLLARTTKALSQAARKENGFAGLVAALDDNQRLWSTLAAEVAGPENGLPQQLRAQLFYLYEFTTQHSRAVRDRKASVDVLIDINTAVMRGLRGQAGAA